MQVQLLGRKGVQGHPNIPRNVLLMNVGTRFAVSFWCHEQELSDFASARQKLSLGDLILAVSSCTKSSRETVATVADLLGSGQSASGRSRPFPAREGLLNAAK